LRFGLLRGRLFRATTSGLRLAALQVLPKGGGEARPLLVVCGCLTVHGNNSVPGFNARNTANSRRMVSRMHRFGQARRGSKGMAFAIESAWAPQCPIAAQVEGQKMTLGNKA
jgi:hypothetical protein